MVQNQVEEASDGKAAALLRSIDEEGFVDQIEDAYSKRGSDESALGRCERRLRTFNQRMDEIEDTLEVPLLRKEAAALAERLLEAGAGTSREALNEHRANALLAAAREGQVLVLRRRIAEAKATLAVQREEDPNFWLAALWFMERKRGDMMDGKAADQLFERGNAAVAGSNLEVLRDTVRKLARLLPEETKAAMRTAFGSSVDA